MILAERVEVAPIGERAANLASGLVGARQTRRHVLEMAAERVSSGVGLGARFVEQRAREDDAEECVAKQIVVRVRDHAQRGEHVGDDGILGERASVRETAGNAGVEKRAPRVRSPISCVR